MSKTMHRICSTALAFLLLAGGALPVNGFLSVSAAGEADISSIGGKVVHLDAQAVNGSDSDTVQTVRNSGSLGDFIQSDSNRSPKYVAESTLNGLPALRFASGSYYTVKNSASAYLEDMTIFVVANASSLPDHGELVSRVAGAPYNHNWFLNIEGGCLNYGWGASSAGGIVYPQSKLTIETNKPTVIVAQKFGEHGMIYLNGILASAFYGTKRPVIPCPRPSPSAERRIALSATWARFSFTTEGFPSRKRFRWNSISKHGGTCGIFTTAC